MGDALLVRVVERSAYLHRVLQRGVKSPARRRTQHHPPGRRAEYPAGVDRFVAYEAPLAGRMRVSIPRRRRHLKAFSRIIPE